jgi:hypothetical protein
MVIFTKSVHLDVVLDEVQRVCKEFPLFDFLPLFDLFGW